MLLSRLIALAKRADHKFLLFTDNAALFHNCRVTADDKSAMPYLSLLAGLYIPLDKQDNRVDTRAVKAIDGATRLEVVDAPAPMDRRIIAHWQGGIVEFSPASFGARLQPKDDLTTPVYVWEWRKLERVLSDNADALALQAKMESPLTIWPGFDAASDTFHKTGLTVQRAAWDSLVDISAAADWCRSNLIAPTIAPTATAYASDGHRAIAAPVQLNGAPLSDDMILPYWATHAHLSPKAAFRCSVYHHKLGAIAECAIDGASLRGACGTGAVDFESVLGGCMQRRRDWEAGKASSIPLNAEVSQGIREATVLIKRESSAINSIGFQSNEQGQLETHYSGYIGKCWHSCGVPYTGPKIAYNTEYLADLIAGGATHLLPFGVGPAGAVLPNGCVGALMPVEDLHAPLDPDNDAKWNAWHTKNENPAEAATIAPPVAPKPVKAPAKRTVKAKTAPAPVSCEKQATPAPIAPPVEVAPPVVAPPAPTVAVCADYAAPPPVHPGQLAHALEAGAWIRDAARRKPAGVSITPNTVRVKTRLETLAAAGFLALEWQGQTAQVRLLRDW